MVVVVHIKSIDVSCQHKLNCYLGFGEGIAHLFAEEGAKVLILDINQEGGERQVLSRIVI